MQMVGDSCIEKNLKTWEMNQEMFNIQSSHIWNGVYYTKEHIEPNRVSQVWNGSHTLWMY